MKTRALRLAALAIVSTLSLPAAAEVRDESDSGFVVQLGLDVPAGPSETWRTLLAPSKWWNAEHTFSQNAANLTLDAKAGGCFCEVLPNKESPNAAPRGSVEHMRVIYTEQPRALRMTGALGPLQSGAGVGTLTVVLREHDAGTRILWEYAYGGYLRGDVRALAQTTDRILADQLLRMGAKLGVAQKTEKSVSEAKGVSRAASGDDFAREMLGGIDGVDKTPVATPMKNKQDPAIIGR